jgi:hypothetical protein
MANQSREESGDEVILSAEELARHYTMEDSGDRDFKGELVRFRGEVLRIDNVISAVVPRVRGIGEKYNGTHLKLHLKDRDDAESLKPGVKSAFQGICQGLQERTSPTGEPVGWITIDEAKVV